jgi:hypothetical protein
MRYLVGFVFVLALGVMECGETACTGGSGDFAGTGGSDGFAGNCRRPDANGGASGSGPLIAPGLWQTDDSEVANACYYVNADCTALIASTECNVGKDASEAHFLEIEWTAGRDEMGEECGAGIGVTTDLVSEVPINGSSFTIEFTDAEAGEWRIAGSFYYDGALTARRTTGDTYCEPVSPVWLRYRWP